MIIEARGDWFVVITWYEHMPSQPKWSIKREYHNHMLDGNKTWFFQRHTKNSQIFETSHAKTIITKHIKHDMLKESRTQSTQAIFCTTIGIEPFFFSNLTPINLFGITHKSNIHQRPESWTLLTTNKNLKVLNKTNTKGSSSKKWTLAE